MVIIYWKEDWNLDFKTEKTLILAFTQVLFCIFEQYAIAALIRNFAYLMRSLLYEPLIIL